jgi:hypothetical protein
MDVMDGSDQGIEQLVNDLILGVDDANRPLYA